MILDANYKIKGQKYFTVKDILKIYARKYFRLAPFYYFALFLGWSSCSSISNGPIWDAMNNDFYNCGSNWWAKMLFIGNIYGFQEPTEGCMYWVWSI
jgi:hypothetical protein